MIFLDFDFSLGFLSSVIKVFLDFDFSLGMLSSVIRTEECGSLC